MALETTRVEIASGTLALALTDSRPPLVSLLEAMPNEERERFARDAWNVGVRALVSAHRGAEEARLKDIGAQLVGDVGTKLELYVKRQDEQLVSNLKRYFDPNDGQVTQRIKRFVEDGGEMAKAMERYLAPETGALAKTLAKELGSESPLLKKLSPTDSEGILKVIEERVNRALVENNAAMTKALDPLAEGGAIARFFVALRKEIEKADDDRTKQITLVTKALDANDESSLLSRLVRESGHARVELVRAMNPDDPNSPLFAIRSSLVTAIEKHAKTQEEAITKLSLQQHDLDKSLRESLARLEERKRGESRSARGGVTFEEAAVRFVKGALSGAPVTVEATGNTAGAIARSKVGDIVLRYTEESAYAGAALVIEVKHDQSYTIDKARKELDEARSNRSAHVGIFVMAKSHAPPSFPSLARYGMDILVTWDEEDDLSDPYLHSALLLGLGLTARGKKAGDEGDIKALAKIEGQIQEELRRHEKMAGIVERMRRDADALTDELRKGSDAFQRLLKNAKQTLVALNVELEDRASEGGEPVLLPKASLQAGRDAQANDAAPTLQLFPST